MHGKKGKQNPPLVPRTWTGAVDDLATEPDTKVTVGEDAVPVIFTVELGSRVTAWPLLKVTTAVDEEVVITSPDTSG